MMAQQSPSVLLVDDDPYTCDLFKLILEHHGLPFSIFQTSADALEYLKTQRPDIIVVDLFLPGIDGYRTLDAIRRLPQLAHSKIVATTSYYTADTQQEVLRRGFDGYIPKPFEASQLVAYLERIVRQRAS